MTRRFEMRALDQSVRLWPFLLTLGLFGTGCAPIATPDTVREEQIVFYPLYSLGSPLVINVLESNEIAWAKKPDASGGGRFCRKEEEFECLVVDGFFTFAIPRMTAADPWPGDHWTFEGQRFEIRSASEELYSEREDWQLLIEAHNEMGWFLFNYDARRGLRFVTLVDIGWNREYESDPHIPILDVFRRGKERE